MVTPEPVVPDVTSTTSSGSSPDSTIQPVGSDVGASDESSPDSPIQQSSDVGASQGSSPDSPIQQGSAPSDASFTSSYNGPTPDFPEYGSNQGSATDSPIQQGSDVGASQTSNSNGDDTKQGLPSASGSGASQKTDVASNSETAGDADTSLTFTEVPKTTTAAPTVASSSSASGSSSNSTTAATTKPSTSLGDNSKLCAKPRIEITKVHVGVTVDANEDEVALKPVAIAAIPSGGSRIAFQSGDSIIVQELDASDKLTGPDVYMIWWYAHHGRIAFDGKNWAAYFGAAISTSEGGCINIHQGDRMKVVDASGKITANEDSFDWGCSHSGYERVTYDNRTDNFAAICKTDSNNRIMPPKDWGTTIYPVDLAASNLGDIVPSGAASKYWATVSNGNGDNAKVHLIHFALNAAASDDITLGGTDANERAPHLASIGNGGLLAMWEGSSSGGDLAEGGDRTIYAQVLDASTGKSISEKVTVDKSVVGNRYQALKSYPDGSVAYLSKGASDTSLQVVRFYGC
eukprot:jgi/Phyca11/130229/e_gw1.92.70.1